MTKMHNKDFQRKLKDDLTQIGEKKGWQQRGYAFQYWCAQQICSYDQGIETEPDEAMLHSKDLGIDLVLEDPTRKALILVQCKYLSPNKTYHISEEDVEKFFSRHKHLMNPDWIRQNGSEAAASALADYSDKVRDGYSIEYWFMSTGKASDRIKAFGEKNTQHYEDSGINATCRLYDFAEIKDLYVRAQSIEESIPEEVIIDLPESGWFIKESPLLTVVCTLKGNKLRDLYRRHKEALFAFNIRSYLGDRGINKEISNTAKKYPEWFFYFNNGVSAICTQLNLEDSTLKASKFQVINGAQTIGALARQEPAEDIEVLMRVTETENVATEKGINSDIILYNNTQNAIRNSDFRANDPIQHHLEERFKNLKPKGPLPNKLVYMRKRGTKKGGSGKGIKLEDFAKIRYAFNHEPTTILSSPKQLWAYEQDGGLYEKAFGVRGEIQDHWTDEEFNKALLAIACYFNTEEKLKHKANEYSSIKRFKWHVLALAGVYFRCNREINISNILSNGEKFENYWNKFWEKAWIVISHSYSRVNNGEITVYAIVRNSEEWSSIRQWFVMAAELSDC